MDITQSYFNPYLKHYLPFECRKRIIVKTEDEKIRKVEEIGRQTKNKCLSYKHKSIDIYI